MFCPPLGDPSSNFILIRSWRCLLPPRVAALFLVSLYSVRVSSLARVHRHGPDVTVKGNLELSKGLCLHLTCVLQLADPVGFLFLEAGHLDLNLNSFLVFLINLVDEVHSLLSPLECQLLGSQLLLLLLLALDHVLHRLRLKLVRFLLHLDHFKVLLALLLQSKCLIFVPAHVIRLVSVDVLSLALAILSVLHGACISLSLTLLS